MARLIKPMVRTGQKARVSLAGPAKSGKTWTALEWAVALEAIEVENGHKGGILGIDTERGEMKLYADKFRQADGERLSHMQWDPPYDPNELREEIWRNDQEYAVIVMDSGSHFWRGEGGTLDIVDQAATDDYKGNRFAGWKEGRPAQNDLIDAITRARCHVIFTMRSEMKYVLETGEDGKSKPKRVGLRPVQSDDTEYEFTVIANMSMDHTAHVVGTRCDLLDGKQFKKGHTVELAETLGEWLLGAEEMISAADLGRITAAVKSLDPSETARCRDAFRDEFGPSDRLMAAEVPAALAFIEGWGSPASTPDPDDDDDPDFEEDDGHDPVDGETRVAEEFAKKAKAAKKKPAKKPAAKKAAKKPAAKKATKKAAAKKQKRRTVQDARSEATPDEGEPWEESATDTHPEDGTSQEGSMSASEAEGARQQIAELHLALPGPLALRLENSFRDAGMWPVAEIPDNRMAEADKILNEIADEVNQGAEE